MYMHAHLRYAQALAHFGDAERVLRTRCARPTRSACASVVPTAALRQANCYYSSSDAAFADRYQAAARVRGRARRADVAARRRLARLLERRRHRGPPVVHHCFLGLRRGCSTAGIDPVIPKALDGLCADVELGGHAVRVRYRVATKGCGPIALSLNGHTLPMTREANPYRTPGVTVPMIALWEHLVDGVNELVVELE